MSFSRTEAGLCIYHLFVWSNLNFLPTQSCLVLYSFCSNLVYSLIMLLMVSSLSPHIIIIIVTPFRVFHICVSRWFLTGVCVTESLQDSSQYSGRFQ